MLAGKRGAETGRQNPAGHARQLLRRDILLHLSRQLEVLEDGGRVEEKVARLPEDERQLLIVVGHHLGREDLLAEGHEAVDVLDGLVGLLPQLHADGGVQLDQPCVQVHLLRLRVVQVDGVGRRILLHKGVNKSVSK